MVIFFFYGPNSYVSRKRLHEVEATYVRKSGSDYGLTRIDGQTASLAAIEVALQAVPFLANSRLVVINGLGKNKAAADGLSKLIKDIPDTTVVVFYETEVDKRSSYFKTLAKAAKVQVFEPLAVAQLVAWAGEEVKRLGGTADRMALAALVERAGDDQWRLAAEINKLVNYAPSVTREMVIELVQPSFSETIFDLVEAMTRGRPDKAAAIYAGLVADKTNEIYILTMLTWQVRNLLMAKAAPPMPSSELARQTGMSPYVAGKMQAAVGAFEEAVLRSMMLAAIDAEYQIKSGQVGAGIAVEQLIFRLASRSANRPA